MLEPAISTSGHTTELLASFTGPTPVGSIPPPVSSIPPPLPQRFQPPPPAGPQPSWRGPMPYGFPSPGPMPIPPMAMPIFPHFVHPAQAAFMNGMQPGPMPMPGPGFGFHPVEPHLAGPMVDVRQPMMPPYGFVPFTGQTVGQQGGNHNRGYERNQQGYKGRRRR